MKILITGASGVLGGEIVRQLKNVRYEAPIEILMPPIELLDITDPEACNSYLSAQKPNIIIHCAAMTDLKQCEDSPDEAFHNNTRGTLNLARGCKAFRSHFIHISTHAIFGQSSKRLDERTKPKSPTCIYAQSKLAAEECIRSELPESRWLILRLGWLISGNLTEDKKFLGNVYRQIQRGNRSLKAVNDVYGSMTYAPEAVPIIIQAALHKHTGTHHLVNQGIVTRNDIMKRFVNAAKLSDVRVEPVSSSAFLGGPNLASKSVLIEKHNLMKMPVWYNSIDTLGKKYRRTGSENTRNGRSGVHRLTYS